MKLTTSTLLPATIITTALAASPSITATYQLRVSANTPSLNNSIVTVEDAGLTISPNPIGVFSTGEPRVPYTVTFATSPLSDAVYELKGALKATHLIAVGDPIARALFDIPIGADPKPAEGEEFNSLTWMATDGASGELYLYLGENKFKNDGSKREDFMSAGSMRACTEEGLDWKFYWYDGLHALEQLVKGCELVSLELEEVSSAIATPPASLTGVPAPTGTTSGLLIGVTAPGATMTGGENSTVTGKPTPSGFTGSAEQIGVAGLGLGVAAGVAAAFF